MVEISRYLKWHDYLIFAILLLISAAIGIFFAWRARKSTSSGDYLLGGRKMSVYPVALSILASFMSAITLLGTPSEIYVYGLQYIWIGVCYAITLLLATQLFLPVFFKLQLSTSYQYLGLRFHKSVQILGACSFILQMVVYMGIVTYAPSLALSAVTGINIWISVTCITIVATFYTTIGGIKAVVWTDVFQTVIMIGGLTLILIKGAIDIGGIDYIWKINKRGGRTELFNMDLWPTTRHTIWTQVFGNALMWCSIYGINQTMVQRALTLKTINKAKAAYWLNYPGLLILMLVCSACGLVIYAAYENCDPVKLGTIKKSDQLLPLFVMDYLSNIPCFAGVFVSSIFSGALSTVSSGINSLASVTLNDILIYNSFFADLSEYEKTRVCKVLAIIYGVLSFGMAVLASYLGQVLQAAIGLFGMLGGPMLGLFSLGMFVPFANWKGALAGHLTSQAAVFWVSFGYYIYQVKPPTLLMTTAGCPLVNSTLTTVNSSTTASSMSMYTTSSVEMYLNVSTTSITSNSQDDIPSVYKLSYTWYCLMGFLITLIVGSIVSLITRDKTAPRVDRDFFSPPVRRLLRSYSNDEDVIEDEKYMDFKNGKNGVENVNVPLKPQSTKL